MKFTKEDKKLLRKVIKLELVGYAEVWPDQEDYKAELKALLKKIK